MKPKTIIAGEDCPQKDNWKVYWGLSENNHPKDCDCQGTGKLPTRLRFDLKEFDKLPKKGDVIDWMACSKCNKGITQQDYKTVESWGRYAVECNHWEECGCNRFDDDSGEYQCGCDFKKFRLTSDAIIIGKDEVEVEGYYEV